MDLRTLSIFTKVAEERHFARAARALGMSAAGVSNAVSRLERRLAVQLISRTTRSVSLTADGVAFFERCRHALREIEEAEWELSRSREVPRGKLCVHVPLAFGYSKIIPLLPRFMEMYPEIEIQIISRQPLELAEDDVAFYVGQIEDTQLIARRVMRLPLVVCGAPSYFRSRSYPVSPKDLYDHTCIAYVRQGSSSPIDWRFDAEGPDGARTARFSPQVGAMRVDNVDHLISAARSGLGLIRVARYLVEEDLRSGRLETVLDGHALSGLPAHILYRQTKYRSPRVRAFVDYVMRELSDGS